MKVTVKLFARARDLAGMSTLEVELPAGATVAQLRRELAQACPALAGLVDRCAVGIDAEFCGDDAVVGESQEIALLPPVSGGQPRPAQP